MEIARYLVWVGAALLTGCAAQPTHVATPPDSARAIMQRLRDEAALDAENQEQFDRLAAIENRQSVLDSALARSHPPSEPGEGAPESTPAARQMFPAQLLFTPGAATIDGKGLRAIEQVAAVLQAGSRLRVEIVGHTDSLPVRRPGSDNWQLSAERARAAANAIIARGIEPGRVRIVGRAATDPTAPNVHATDRAKNRRVEFFILSREYGDAR